MRNRIIPRTMLVLMMCFVCLMTACSSKSNTISYTSMYPAEIDSYVDENMPIQLLYYTETQAYLIYYDDIQSRAFLSVEDDILTIHINTDEDEEATSYEQPQQQIFKLQLESGKFDTIQVELNGQPTHFDRIIGPLK